MSDPQAGLSATKRALIEIRELRARLAGLEGAAREPVAIIGLSIRAPGGVHDAASLAELLWNGRDAIGPIPASRWQAAAWYDADPGAPGKTTTRFGGFLEGIDLLDAGFFGISPLEAASMDPQQRLMLELAWHALEDAAHSPAALAGTRTGVYLGIANGDYGRALFAQPDLIDPYFSPGNAFSVASGRVAYVLGLQGPAISVDTACSSSLVALHLACQGLRHGDCNLALAGGVNVILSPEIDVNFSKAGMMAPDGRCKTFDARADGYVRGEGGGMVVLRLLRDAVAAGDRILAVIRGSAVNQDGRSNGLTAPNGPSQEAVLRAALAAAGAAPGDVGYIEAHGTGTSLGDPIEVNAIAKVFGPGRDAARPLAVGSIKTNIGHLEAAAGIAGVAKAILALQRGEVPPHLHLETPNPFIDWDSMPLTVPTRATPWMPGPRRLAGVSSFGFSGTNAHVLLEEAPTPAPRTTAGERPRNILALSAHDAGALGEVVNAHRRQLAAEPADLADYCFTVNAGRSHLAHRVVVHGSTPRALDAALDAWHEGRAHPALEAGTVGPGAPRIAFLFPGQGPQYLGMGSGLYQTAPAFREAFDACCAALDPHLPQPLHQVVHRAGDASPLDETIFAQPAMFAMEVSLAALWRSWGVEPVAVLGHSFGEYAAAHVAGALTLADAALMVATRGRLVQALPREGSMAVLEAAEPRVTELIASHGGRVTIAAVNGGTNTVISGERHAVEAIVATVAAGGARTRILRVSHAFHSPLIDPVLDQFERSLGAVSAAEPRVALVSSLTGGLADRSLIGHARYWRRHMREPVRFADGIRVLAAQGITHFIELSPHPVLLGMGSEVVQAGQWLPSLREGTEEWATMFEALSLLYCDGASIDWAALDRGHDRRRVPAPFYPFQRRRHWVDVPAASPAPGGPERWERVSAVLDAEAGRAPLDMDVGSYPAKYAALRRVTHAHAIDTLRRAGLFARAGERRDLDDVLAAAGIAPTYRHLIARWLDGLAADGVLARDGSAWRAVAPLPDPRLGDAWADAARLFTDNQPLFDYVRHCGSLVFDVLAGRESPLETLFPGGSFDLALGLYERSATMRYINQLAASAFRVLGAMTPAGQVLRVLEVGAGTGGTTSSLLPVLPSGRRRYRLSDVSDVFLEHARDRFGEGRGVDFGIFDLDRDLDSQGYEAGSLDVIVAANAVHAVKDLRSALARLHTLLAPGGMLVLVESTRHLDYFDMTTGLIEGWQHFADDLRGDNPLLPAARWVEALEAAGFARAQAWPEPGSPAEALGQHVIVAQVAGDVPVMATTIEPAGGLVAASPSTPRAGAPGAWRARLDEVPAMDRLDLLRDLVRAEVMRVLRLDPSAAPARHDRLMDLGMDSLMAVQLRNALTQGLALMPPLPSTLMFDYPTIDAMAEHLESRLAPGTVPIEPPTKATSPALDAAAVAGLSDAEIERLLDDRLGAR